MNVVDDNIDVVDFVAVASVVDLEAVVVTDIVVYIVVDGALNVVVCDVLLSTSSQQ